MLRRPEIAVALVAVLVHASALGGGYTWLDHSHLEQGLALAPPGDWWGLFTRGFAGTGFYRPLVSLSLSLDAGLAREAWFFRAVTLAWHAVAAATTVVTAKALGLTPRAALLAGVGFAIHPATALVADAIAFRSESMTAVALCALVVAHLRGRPGVAAAAVFLGALVKETAWVLAPVFVVVLELEGVTGRSRPRSAPSVRRRLLGSEALALAGATALRLAFAPPFRASFPGWSLDDAAGTRLAALSRSALSLAGLGDRALCDASPVVGVLSGPAVLGAAAAAGIVVLAWRRRGPALLFALALVPSLQLVPVMRFWSPHYLYLPLVFGVMLVAESIERAGKPALAGSLALGLACAGLSFEDGFRFRNDVSLFRYEVARRPECREAHLFLGDAARAASRWPSAAAHYERALAVTPGVVAYVDPVAAHYGLGATRLAQKRFEDAREAWTAAVALSTDGSDRRKLEHNLATLSLNQGDAAEAERLLRAETERAVPLAESLFVRARALRILGRHAEAAALIARLPRETR